MEFKDVLLRRQSIRTYQKEHQITEKQLECILSAGMAAPISQKDYGSIKITVVQEKERLKYFTELYGSGSDPCYGAPTVVLLSSRQAAVKGVEHFNVACMMENMMLAATDLGLASIYLTCFLKQVAQSKTMLQDLGIPEGYLPLSAMAVGYAADESVDKENPVKMIRKRIEVMRK